MYSYYIIESIELNKLRAKGEKDLFEAQRKEFIESVSEIISQKNLLQKIIETVNNNMKIIKRSLARCGYTSIEIKARLITKGLFGTGFSFGKITWEVGLYLDSFLNIPYIPGSEIKGAIRNSWNALYKEKTSFKDNKLEDMIFGTPERAGAAIFFDAYPIDISESRENHLMIPDVTSPHYAGESEESIHEAKAMPTPIQFLVISPGTIFKFIMGMKKETFEDKKILREAIRRLGAATYLAFSHGIGAKTMVGYSIFKIEDIKIDFLP